MPDSICDNKTTCRYVNEPPKSSDESGEVSFPRVV